MRSLPLSSALARITLAQVSAWAGMDRTTLSSILLFRLDLRLRLESFLATRASVDRTPIYPLETNTEMTTITHTSALRLAGSNADEYVLDPRKSLPDYRREIYDLLQYLDEEQDKIEKQLARFSSTTGASSSRKAARRASTSSQRRRVLALDDGGVSSESDDDNDEADDFVVVEDLNAANRKKQLLSQLQQLWRTRDALRKRAKQLNIRIDSLTHGTGSGLMTIEDFSHAGDDVHGQDDHDEL